MHQIRQFSLELTVKFHANVSYVREPIPNPPMRHNPWSQVCRIHIGFDEITHAKSISDFDGWSDGSNLLSIMHVCFPSDSNIFMLAKQIKLFAKFFLIRIKLLSCSTQSIEFVIKNLVYSITTYLWLFIFSDQKTQIHRLLLLNVILTNE